MAKQRDEDGDQKQNGQCAHDTRGIKLGLRLPTFGIEGFGLGTGELRMEADRAAKRAAFFGVSQLYTAFDTEHYSYSS